jgi:hypothetical protein
MRLFSFNDNKIDISPEAFALKAFRAIWNRDKSAKKERALQEFGFIYFMCDPRSNYSYFDNDTDRADEIRKDEGLDKKWKPDSLVDEAMELYKKNTQTTSSILLDRSRKAADNLGKKLAKIDLDALDNNGKPVYTIQSMAAALKLIPDVVKNIIDTEELVGKELAEKTDMRGGREKKIGEDGILGFFKDE